MRGLWTFERGDWDLRVRADVPRVDLIQADEAIGNFVHALNAAQLRDCCAVPSPNKLEADAVTVPTSAAGQ